MQLITLLLSSLLLFSIFCPSTSASVISDKCERTPSSEDNIRRHCFTVTLSSGVTIKNILYLYAREEWSLGIYKSAFTIIHPDKEISKDSLSGNEFRELIDQLLGVIGEKYNGNIDSIQLTLDVVTPILEDMVQFLRDAPIPKKHLVKGKDIVFVRAAGDFFDRDKNLAYLCNKVKEMGRTCGKHVASLDPLVFWLQYIGKPWGKVKIAPDAGLDKAKIWYEISFDKL